MSILPDILKSENYVNEIVIITKLFKYIAN